MKSPKHHRVCGQQLPFGRGPSDAKEDQEKQGREKEQNVPSPHSSALANRNEQYLFAHKVTVNVSMAWIILRERIVEHFELVIGSIIYPFFTLIAIQNLVDFILHTGQYFLCDVSHDVTRQKEPNQMGKLFN